MSNQQFSSSSYSFSSTSYSSSSSSNTSNGQSTQSGERHLTTSYTDPSGQTTVQTGSQTLGQPAVLEERRFDSQGQELLGGTGSDAGQRRIEEVGDEEQKQRDREYEEKIEEEYAKREGGA